MRRNSGGGGGGGHPFFNVQAVAPFGIAARYQPELQNDKRYQKQISQAERDATRHNTFRNIPVRMTDQVGRQRALENTRRQMFITEPIWRGIPSDSPLVADEMENLERLHQRQKTELEQHEEHIQDMAHRVGVGAYYGAPLANIPYQYQLPPPVYPQAMSSSSGSSAPGSSAGPGEFYI